MNEDRVRWQPFKFLSLDVYALLKLRTLLFKRSKVSVAYRCLIPLVSMILAVILPGLIQADYNYDPKVYKLSTTPKINPVPLNTCPIPEPTQVQPTDQQLQHTRHRPRNNKQHTLPSRRLPAQTPQANTKQIRLQGQREQPAGELEHRRPSPQPVDQRQPNRPHPPLQRLRPSQHALSPQPAHQFPLVARGYARRQREPVLPAQDHREQLQGVRRRDPGGVDNPGNWPGHAGRVVCGRDCAREGADVRGAVAPGWLHLLQILEC